MSPFSGSSPLTRGKRRGIDARPRTERLIPAHAGKTGEGRSTSWARTAHPRSRGENSCGPRPPRRPWGSSPLTRGKHDSGRTRRPGLRLIPAHAGKTGATRTGPNPRGAHPRSRGENWLLVAVSVGVEGSSPLTRGKPSTSRGYAPPRRLIPAHAGKTPVRTGRRRRGGAHPRSRGENSMLKDRLRYEDGSSPLTRGKQGDAGRVGAHRRLIPAHAGKTLAQSVGRDGGGAHPRSRGENGPRAQPGA